MNVKKSSLSIRNSSPQEKITLRKKALRRAPYKLLLNLENSQVFRFSISTNVFGGDSSSPPAGKIY
jgi:hypothetical protein